MASAARTYCVRRSVLCPRGIAARLGSKNARTVFAGTPDISSLLAPANRTKVLDNLVRRGLAPEAEQDGKAWADAQVRELLRLKDVAVQNPGDPEARTNLVKAAFAFPNTTHPDVAELSEPRLVGESEGQGGPRRLQQNRDNMALNLKARSFEELAKTLGNCLRTENTGQVASERSYYLMGPLAELEQALIRYTVDVLTKRYGFRLMSVPDVLDASVLEACGMAVDGERTQVYKLEPKVLGHGHGAGALALSGTAEMAFGGYFRGKRIDFSGNHRSTSIQNYCAVSRCFRAESSRGKAESGIYRVHHFTKVEMFGLTPGTATVSNWGLEKFLDIQRTLFDGLGLAFRVLDMPPHELGNPAHRKFDIEALFPGRRQNGAEGSALYGEISSCSNCTDYQSRRLDIRNAADNQFCHTINGTACAVPRMLMAICEQHQTPQGGVEIPEKLVKYMPRASLTPTDSNGPNMVPAMQTSLMEPRTKRDLPVFKYVKSPKYFVGKFIPRQALE